MSDNITMSVKDINGTELIVGDIVKGSNDFYDVSNYNMTKGRILKIKDDKIYIRILNHKMVYCIGCIDYVKADLFKKIGHIKRFVREEFFEHFARSRINCNRYLYSVDTRNADLKDINLEGIDLHSIDFRNTNLRNTNLRNADLRGANLRGANLEGAYLRGANLEGVKYDSHTAFFSMACPEEGSFIAWKKCCDGLMVKLRVTEDAKRSSATTRKCRCSKAEVLAIEDFDGSVMPKGTVAHSKRDYNFTYEVGKIVEVADFDEDRWRECSTGIHFFITKREALLYI